MVIVSIHALAGSATQETDRYNFTLTRFNPRTRGECDIAYGHPISKFKTFQSTHSRGVRPDCRGATGTAGTGFNPRTRGECDLCN